MAHINSTRDSSYTRSIPYQPPLPHEPRGASRMIWLKLYSGIINSHCARSVAFCRGSLLPVQTVFWFCCCLLLPLLLEGMNIKLFRAIAIHWDSSENHTITKYALGYYVGWIHWKWIWGWRWWYAEGGCSWTELSSGGCYRALDGLLWTVNWILLLVY